jgi:hypothetical protein
MTKQTDDARGELLARLEKIELRLLCGDQHDRNEANDIGRAVHFLRPAPVPQCEAEPGAYLADGTKIKPRQLHPFYDDATPLSRLDAGSAQAMEYARRLNDIALNCEIAAFEGEGDASDLRRIAEWLAALVPPPSEAGREGIYIASKTRHAARWRAMREAGAPIISTWIDEAGEGEIADLHDLWDRCLSESKSCQSLIVYREPQDVLKGAWVEIGAALAVGVPVYAVGLDGFTISKYRSIKHFATIDEAFAAALSPDPGTVAAASVEVKTP